MAIDDYSNLFDSAGQQYGVDPQLLRAIAQTESSGNPNAVNEETNAKGLMQLIPATAKSLGVDNPNDPEQAINGAAKLMAENIKRYGNPQTAILAYHGGTDPSNWGNKTHNYLQKVWSSYKGDNSLQGSSGSDTIQDSNSLSPREMLAARARGESVGDENTALSPELSQELGNTDFMPKSSAPVANNANVSSQEKSVSPREMLAARARGEDISNEERNNTPIKEETPIIPSSIGVPVRAALSGISALPRMAVNFPTNLASAVKNAYEELVTPENRLAIGAESAPFQEPLSSQDFSNQLISAGLPSPQTRPERLISDVIEGATGAAAGGGGSILGAIGGGLGGGASGYVREQGGTPGQQLAASLAGNLLLPGIGTVASLASKEVNPLISNAAKQAEDQYGITIPNAQLTTNPPVKWLSSVLPNIPFSGFGGEADAAKTQFNTAISHTIGENTPNLTREVMDNAGERIGKMYDEVADAVPKIKISDDALDKLATIDKKASETLLPDEYSLIKKQIDNVLDKSSDGHISNDAFKNIMDSNSSLSSLTKSGNTGSRQAAYEIKNALYGALNDSAPDDVQNKLQLANKFYKNYKTIEPLADKDPITGEINPLLLLNKVNQTSNKFGDKGLSDLQNLADIGNKFFKQMPSSGTSERAALMGYLGAGGAGGFVSHLMSGNVPEAVGTLGTLAGTSVAANLAGRAINSQAYRNMLLNNTPNYLPAISGGLATNRLVNP